MVLFYIDHTMVFTLGCQQQRNQPQWKMQGNCWWFWSPCGCGGAMWDASPNEAKLIPDFTRSQWMLPLGECLRRITPAAAVDEFVATTQNTNTNKTQVLASNYSAFWLLVAYENFVPQIEPSTQLIDATSLFKCKTPWLELRSSSLSSYQTM